MRIFAHNIEESGENVAGRKRLKTGVVQGGGPPPGYSWNVGILDVAYNEAIEMIAAHQYRHLAWQFKELAMQRDPTRSELISLDQIEDFYELRDRGGPLGPLNVRVFFGVDDAGRSIIVLGTIAKKNDGKTRLGDKVRMRRRWRALVKEHPQLRPLLVRDAEVGSLWSGDNRQPLENRVVKELRSEKRPVEFRRQHPRDHQVRLTLGIRIIFVHGKLIEIPAYLSYGVETGLRARTP